MTVRWLLAPSGSANREQRLPMHHNRPSQRGYTLAFSTFGNVALSCHVVFSSHPGIAWELVFSGSTGVILLRLSVSPSRVYAPVVQSVFDVDMHIGVSR